jgi:deoxyribonuclease-4
VLIGAHVSPAGGPANAIQRGREKGCRAIQFFNQSPRAWRPTIYTDEQVAAYHEAKRGSGVDALLIHAVYLLNAATTDRAMRRKTRDALIVALQAGDKLGARGVVLHAGSAKTGSVKPAITRAGKVIREALSESDGCPLHLENTAGAGGTLGRSFGELAALMDAAGGHERLGLCLDSCHLYASGFDIRTEEGLASVLDECVDIVGIDRLGSLHLNDSQVALGSNRDRHAAVGDGELGAKGCAVFLSEPRFQDLPCVLETGRKGEPGPPAEQLALCGKLRQRGLRARKRRGAGGARN